MIDPINIKELRPFLESHSLLLSKRMGQNFLIDKNVLEKIVTAGDLSKKDSVIEIGAGVGTLTLELAKRAKRVIAIEKDQKLIPLLKEITSKIKNIKIVNEDVLSFCVPFKNYKVVANVPYYITSPIIRKFLEEKHQPSLLILTVQKEVAQRIMAKPPKMNLLAVSVQFFATPKIISNIPPSSFHPAPKVTSSILSIIPYNKIDRKLQKTFFLLAKTGFSHPRKQLIKNFKLFVGNKEYSKKIEEVLEKMNSVGISPKRRAETLTIEEWVTLTKLANETRR